MRSVIRNERDRVERLGAKGKVRDVSARKLSSCAVGRGPRSCTLSETGVLAMLRRRGVRDLGASGERLVGLRRAGSGLGANPSMHNRRGKQTLILIPQNEEEIQSKHPMSKLGVDEAGHTARRQTPRPTKANSSAVTISHNLPSD